MAITCSKFEIESSSFGFSVLSMCLKNHVLQLRLYSKFSNDLNLNSNFVKSLFRKSKKVWNEDIPTLRRNNHFCGDQIQPWEIRLKHTHLPKVIAETR